MDANVCPRCGGVQSIQELQEKVTWQPILLELGEGGLSIVGHGSFDYGDDVTVTGYHCRQCEHHWASLAELYAELTLVEIRGAVIGTLSDGDASDRIWALLDGYFK